MDRQARTAATYLGLNVEGGWGGCGVKTTENKIHWLRWLSPNSLNRRLRVA